MNIFLITAVLHDSDIFSGSHLFEDEMDLQCFQKCDCYMSAQKRYKLCTISGDFKAWSQNLLVLKSSISEINKYGNTSLCEYKMCWQMAFFYLQL